jgi:GTP-binding protein
MKNFNVVLLGKANVGKSSVFNRLNRKRIAITLDMPGTTIDYQESIIANDPVRITLVDTGGYQVGPTHLDLDEQEQKKYISANNAKKSSGSMNKKSLDKIAFDSPKLPMQQNHLEKNTNIIWHQAKNAIKKADLLLFVTSLTDLVTQDDIDCIAYIRSLNIQKILLINKCETNSYVPNDFYQLGFDQIISTSCKSGNGFEELRTQIAQRAAKKYDIELENDNQETPHGSLLAAQRQENDSTVKMAIIGRPNVGKSTIINSILKQDRVVVSPVPGTTRDSVHIIHEENGVQFELIDTAGIRKKYKTGDKIESIAVFTSVASIDLADICVIVLDATQPLERQDLHIIDLVSEKGKIPIIIFNKWDLIQDKKNAMLQIEHMLSVLLVDISHIECIFLSAIKSHNDYNLLFNKASELSKIGKNIISTHKLNKWLILAKKNHQAPMIKKRRLKMKYITQKGTMPLSFVIFASQDPIRVPQHYVNYLRNSLVEEFALHGVPVYLEIRCSENPYAPIIEKD